MQEQYGINGEAEEGPIFSIADAIAVVKRRLKLIAAVVLVVSACAAAFALMLPNRYTAFSTVMVDGREKNVTNIGKVIEGVASDTPGIESQVEILASRQVSLRVIEKLGLRADPEFGGSAAASPAASQQLKKDYVLAAFRNSMAVGRVRNTRLVKVSFTASDAVKAARIANMIAETHVALELEQKIQQARKATAFLETRLDALRLKVTLAERNVASFKSQNNIFAVEGQLLSEKQLARLMEQTIVARNTTAEAKSKYHQINDMISSGNAKGAVADVLHSHTVRMLKDQYAKLTGRLAELSIKYGERHPSMQKAKAEVRDIEGQLGREVDKIVFNLKNEYEVARKREATLRANLAALKLREGELKQADVKLKDLEREAKTSRQLFEALLSRYKQTAETQAMQLPDSRVVEAAEVPLRPSSPKRKRIVLMGFVGSLMLAFGLVFALEFLGGGIARPEDVERTLDLEHLGSLPQFGLPGEGAAGSMRAIRQMIAEPHGAFAEAMRSLRHALDGRSAHGAGQRPAKAGARLILVCSSLPGEGKSVVASNLAHHYAMTGANTLLIDADLRKAGLTRDLAPSAQAGLLDCVSAHVPAHLAILRDAKTGLSFLPARSSAPSRLSAAEALVAPQTRTTLDQLRRQFDVVIIDCPPVLPVSDARILADHAEQIVLVMAWRRTPKELAKRAVRSLGVNASKIAGVVVNQNAADQLATSMGYGNDGYYAPKRRDARAA